MEIRQLRYFLAVADEGTFTAAAARVHVSQSGVSTQIAKLERELGVFLFVRGRVLELTPAGESVLPLARKALADVEAISFTAAEFAEAVRGPVRLGAIPGCTVPGFLDVVANVRRSHAGISLYLSEGSSAELQARIRTRTLDIALTGYAGDLPEEFEQTIIADERLHAFAPASTRLGSEPRLSQIQQHPVLCLPRGSGIRAAYEQSCARLGCEARVDLEASSPLTLLGLAQRGGGIAILPAAIDAGENLTVTPIADADVHARLGLISRREQTAPAIRVVRNRLRSVLIA